MRWYLYLLIVSLLFLCCQQELSFSDEEVLPNKNALIVNSNPPDAAIYINSKNTGQFTPDTIFWLPSGSTILTLKMELFKDSSVVLNIREKDTVSIFLDFIENKSMRGRLYLGSNPQGANIFINDSAFAEKTPYRIDGLLPGYYKVNLKRSGFWDGEKTAAVKSQVTSVVDLQLVDSTIWVNYNTARVPLPSDYLTCVAIDKYDVVWAGTIDSGAVRFDGSSWKIFNTSNSLIPDEMINAIIVDPNNDIWFCTNNGAAKKSGDTWTIFNTLNSGLPDDRVLSVTFDNNKIWFGTMKGLALYDGTSWTVFNKSNSMLLSNIINAVLIHNSNLWVCCYGGVVLINDTNWTVYKSQDFGFPNNNCRNAAIDLSGKTWVVFGADGEIPGGTAVKENGWTSFLGLPSTDVMFAVVDRQNMMWFANSTNGFAKLDNTSWIVYNRTNSPISTDRIFSIAVDSRGYKWLAGFGGGLIKYKGN